jgi:hypothetical protein
MLKRITILFTFSSLSVFTLFSYQAMSCYGQAKVNDVVVTLNGKPTELKHCQVYSMDISAVFNNPAVRKEIKESESEWTLSKSVGYNKSLQNIIPTDFPDVYGAGDYEMLISQKSIKSLSATWQVFKYKNKSDGSGGDIRVNKRNWNRASFFKKPGYWNVNFVATFKAPMFDKANNSYILDNNQKKTVQYVIWGEQFYGKNNTSTYSYLYSRRTRWSDSNLGSSREKVQL